MSMLTEFPKFAKRRTQEFDFCFAEATWITDVLEIRDQNPKINVENKGTVQTLGAQNQGVL